MTEPIVRPWRRPVLTRLGESAEAANGARSTLPEATSLGAGPSSP